MTDAQSLDDVIVVAYGTVRREAKTGSVASMSGESIGELPVTSAEKMLQGKMAGVQISSMSGKAGAPTSIRIRGASSINAGSEPLWVIDGIPMITNDQATFSNVGSGDGGSTLASINPNDIESITVLKDAAAASIYGSRAANGVILVTTKSGKAGVSRFTARAKYGVSVRANDNGYDAMSAEQLLNYQRVSIVNAGHDPDSESSPWYRPMSLLDGDITNWVDHFSRTGITQDYEINATGGNDKGAYYSSLAYHNNQGVYYGDDYQRFTARVNTNYKLLKTLKTGVRLNLSYVDQKGTGITGDSYYANPAQGMIQITPWTLAYDENGNHSLNIPQTGNTNPRAIADHNEGTDKQYRINASTYLEWKPIKQLTIKTNNAVDATFVESRYYESPEASATQSSTMTMYSRKKLRYTTSNTIAYDDLFADAHSVRVLAGQEAMIDTYDYIGGESPNVDPLIPYPPTSSGTEDEVKYGYNQETLLSFFGILDYNYMSKYYLTASLRSDGSSLFANSNRWGLFWSIGTSWNIHNEDFLKSIQWIDVLKLRASYGVNGNNSIDRYQAFGLYSTSQYSNTIGYAPSRIANPNLTWELNKTWNIGLDFTVLDGRVNGSVDIYNRLTEDMLLEKRVPQTTGFETNMGNIGSMSNNGVEILLEGNIIRTKDFVWNIGANIAFNRTKILELGESEFITAIDPRTDNETMVRIVEGMSMFNYWVRDWYGVNPSTGEPLWWSKDGALTSDRGKAAYIYAGSPEPKFTGGFNTSFTWKGLSLSAFFEFVYGNKVIINQWGRTDGVSMNTGALTYALDYWEKPGDSATNPIPVAGNPQAPYVGYNSRWIQDGSYLRIRDITLSYQIPSKFLSKAKLQGLKVYISASNPYTFHDVSAMDPELGSLGYSSAGEYGMLKSVIGGIEISF